MSMVRKINSIAYALILAGLCMGLAGMVSADAIAEGKAAEKAGRYEEALKHYVTALESTKEAGAAKRKEIEKIVEIDLRQGLYRALDEAEREAIEKIIAIALKMKPPPKIPDAVIEHEGRAEAAVQMAKKPEDFLLAAREYREATRLAPWVARYYFNLGVVLEKSGRLAEAAQNYELYLLAALGAPDEREVKKKIAGLKFQQEMAGKEQAEIASVPHAQPLQVQDLVGEWRQPNESVSRWQLEANGDYLVFYTISQEERPDLSIRRGERIMHFTLILDGRKLSGPPPNGPFGRVDGSVSENGQRIELSYPSYDSRLPDSRLVLVRP